MKKIIIIISIILFIICGISIGYYAKEKSIKLKYEEEYKEQLNKIVSQINVEVNNMQTTKDEYIKSFESASNGYITVNANTGEIYTTIEQIIDGKRNAFKKYGIFDEFDKSRERINDNITKLGAPPDKYKELFSNLLGLYNDYYSYITLLEAPGYSQNNFNNDADRIINSIRDKITIINNLLK